MKKSISSLFYALFVTMSFCMTIAAQPQAIFTVNFGTDVHELDEVAEQIMVRQLINVNPTTHRVQLVGHTDIVGSLEYNQALSERRANSVKSRLIAMGFLEENIQSDARAFLDPTDQADTELARARNRRVDVIVEALDWNVSSDFFIFNPEQGGNFTYERSGTQINVPLNAFQHKDGSPVEGDVVLMYREFRDFADFMASTLPMNFNWEGQAAYFNSTGMFEIRGYDMAGKALELVAGKEVELDFVQTQTLEGTQFWRYDETDSNWESGDNYITYEDGEMIRVAIGYRSEVMGQLSLLWPEKWLWNGDMDTIRRLQEAHGLLREVVQSSKAYDFEYIPQLDMNTFRTRSGGNNVAKNYAGTQYIGHLPFNLVYENPEYYNIQLQSSSADPFTVSIIDVSGQNPELAAVESWQWRIREKDLKKAFGQETLTQKYCDIRILKTDKNKYTLWLKYQNHIKIVPVKPIAPDQSTRTSLSEAMAEYRKALKLREKSFDEALHLNLEKALLLWPCTQLLLPQELNPDEARLKGMRTAIRSYVNSNRDINWPVQPLNSGQGLSLNTLPGFEFLASSAHLFKQELTGEMLAADQWRERIHQFPPIYNGRKLEKFGLTIIGEVPIYEDVYRAFEQPIPKLRIKGMGVFNLDVLKNFEEEQRLIAKFLDENGKDIDFQRVEIINHRLNGLLEFKSSEIILDLEAPNTIVVFARNGSVYYLRPADIQALDLKNKKTVAFRTNNLGDLSGRPEKLRELFTNS
ncbi:MAG TPA: OmpA family protein [Saprospiraceae bacterium]|nr:OmpA family protein [Saprospiraceae bacterium]HMQ82530.1 OmpA family protein [Saprospiraceae bacterium]